jgi:biopolymer transport protein ExbB/biopolymer transport protein TolQ
MAIMSIWSLSVTIKKAWDLRKAQAETRKFAPEFSQFLEEDNLAEAVTLSEKYKKSHVARVLGGALTEIKPLIQDGTVSVGDINSAERAIEREMLMTITDLKRGLAILATVGATAPFVGLLGTTMGIVNAFTGMAASGSGGLSAISSGVAEALITTAFGLLVAIPAVWAYNYFQTKIDNLTEAVNLSEKYKKSHVARVLGGALQEIKPLIQDGTVSVGDINSAERSLEREMLMTITDLKRGLAILATVGATAPFVGLLGTTMGIVNAFTGMAASGSGGLSAISSGVAEALITTAFGLLVAIPAVWAYNYFTTKIENLTAEMTYTSKEMIDYMIKNVSGEFGRSRFTREFNTTASSGNAPISS